MKLQPFASIYPKSDGPICRLLFAAGLHYGQRHTPRPDGSMGIWIIRHRRLWSRTAEPDGSLRDHYKLGVLCIDLQLGGRLLRLELRPGERPRLGFAAAA